MFPAINAAASSYSGSATTARTRARAASSESAGDAEKASSWRRMHHGVSTSVGGSPYGPGRIETTAHEQVIVNSFRDFMSTAGAREGDEDGSSLDEHMRRFRTVTWSIAAVQTMSHMYHSSKLHQRHVQKSEYYAKMRGTHREHKDPEAIEDGKKRRQRASKRQSKRHSIGKHERGHQRVKTPRGTYIENCKALGVTPDARIIVGTDQQTYFNFAQAGCSSNQIIALIQALGECNSAVVEQLNISTNSFTNADLTKVIAALRVDEIMSLDLSRNTFGGSAAVELRDLMLNDVANIQDINLCSCNLRRGHLKTLNAAFLRSKTLRRLHLGRNAVDDSMAGELLVALRESDVEELDLSWNNINAAASRFLEECPKLRWLNLEMNNLKKGTEAAWAAALAKNKTLQWLDLSGAAWSAAECEVVGRGLKKNHTLLELRMDQMHACEVHTTALGFLAVYDHVVDDKPHVDAKVYEWLDQPPILCRQTDKGDVDAALHGAAAGGPDGDEHDGGAAFDAMVSLEERKASAWITDGWTHFTWSVDPEELLAGGGVLPLTDSGDAPGKFSTAGKVIKRVFIHLQADEFAATRMEESQVVVAVQGGAQRKSRLTASRHTKTVWRVDRIMPPGRQFFFFSCEYEGQQQEEGGGGVKDIEDIEGGDGGGGGGGGGSGYNGEGRGEEDDILRAQLLSSHWGHQYIVCEPGTTALTGETVYRVVKDVHAPGKGGQRGPGQVATLDSVVAAKAAAAAAEGERERAGRSLSHLQHRGGGGKKHKKQSLVVGNTEKLRVNFYDVLVRLPQQPLFIGRCVPRPNPGGDDEDKWDLMKSVFVPRLKEADSRAFYNTEGLMRQAFKHDWKMSNIPAFVTDMSDQTAVWQLLKDHYVRLMDVFFYCAGIGMSFSAGEKAMHKWSWMTFSRWVASIGLQGTAKGLLTSHETDIIFITCNVKVNNDDLPPDRFLSRYEFLQAIVRLAMKRYAWKEGASVRASTARLLDEYVFPHSRHIEGNDHWRRRRLYTQGVSEYFMSILRPLRAKYLNLSAGGGWADEVGGKMSYAEFKDFILTHKLLDGVKRVSVDDVDLDHDIQGFNEMHCKLAFTNSMMVVKNDAATFKHTRMTFVDFIEALGRLCDAKEPGSQPLEEKLPAFIEKYVWFDPNHRPDPKQHHAAKPAKLSKQRIKGAYIK